MHKYFFVAFMALALSVPPVASAFMHAPDMMNQMVTQDDSSHHASHHSVKDNDFDSGIASQQGSCSGDQANSCCGPQGCNDQCGNCVFSVAISNTIPVLTHNTVMNVFSLESLHDITRLNFLLRPPQNA